MPVRDWVCFILFWGIAILLVNPLGEFPLNDDWGYARVVQQLVDTGEYNPGTWPVMTLFTQVLWGSLFAGVFGFSFTILRISTLVLAILGSYWLFRESLQLSGDRFWSWVALLCLALNPLYFHLAFTFMTDVPFTVAIIGVILLYRRAIEGDNSWYWAAACLATTAATLIRQPALLLVPAFGLAVLIRRPGWKSALWAFGNFGLTYGALLGYLYFIAQPGDTPGTPDSLVPLLRRLRFPLILDLFVKRGGMILFYLAVFLSPLVSLNLSQRLKTFSYRRILILSGTALATTLLFAVFSWEEIPAGNIIDFFGLGPTPLVGRDSRYLEASAIPALIWPCLRLTGYAAMMLFFVWLYDRLARLAAPVRWQVRTYWKLGLALFILAYGLYLLLDRYHFDRYQLALLPAAALLLSPVKGKSYTRWTRILIAALLVLAALFSLGATRDYLSWNRVRWKALNNTMKENSIPPDQIDGGLEFNGWYDTAPQGPFSFEHKSWWFVKEDQYVLSFSRELPCTVRRTPYPVNSWWPGRDTLYVHERPAVLQRDTIFSDLEQLAADSTKLATSLATFALSDAHQRVSDRAHSGRYAFFLTPERPYAGKVSLQPVQACEAITISAWRFGNDRSAGIVASAPDANVYHTFQNIFTEDHHADGWHRIRHEIRLPEDYPSDQLDIYLWNPVKDSIWMDDVEVIWRRIE